MKIIKLDGKFKLYPFKDGDSPVNPQDLECCECFDAAVPGNVEQALISEGVIPDVYYGENVENTRKYELYDWWFVKHFNVQNIDSEKQAFLVFDGVDTYAEYFLNGERIGESDNALISHEFAVEKWLKKGENQLAVLIKSSIKKSEGFEVNPSLVATWECFPGIRSRRPAHSYGWDIFPRLVSAGVWRGVRLEFRPKIRIEEVYLSTVFTKDDLAGLCFYYQTNIPACMYGRSYIELCGKAEGSEFKFEYKMPYKAETRFPYVESPVLWWPNGMGNASLYDIKVRLYDDKRNILDEKELKFGIRHIRLERKPFAGENGFRFIVNNKPIFCKGANWIPLDVLHSRDSEKCREAVLSLVENNSNMVRVWGGGVYEDEEFFELCDRYGIMVWQDFMLACHAYPQDEAFCRQMSDEAESVIKRIRNHPSLALYCGSNETDWLYFCTGQDPNLDVITRRVLGEQIKKNDPYRLYYPTTPIFDPEYVKEYGGKFLIDLDEIEKSRVDLSEDHYWWHRDDYKTYSMNRHNFVGEIGYSGCPSVKSLERFMDIAKLTAENEYSGECWRFHDYSTDGDVRHASKYYFGDLPSTLEDFVLSSQISQAEAYKYVIEKTRIKREYCTGVLLWVLRDGWPSYNSGMIDYYGDKKIAYYYVKQSQQPLVMILSDDMTAYVSNDTLQEKSGKYRILNKEGKLILDGAFTVGANQNAELGQFENLSSEDYLILEVEENGTTFLNHYAKSKDRHELEEYKRFLEIYRKKL